MKTARLLPPTDPLARVKVHIQGKSYAAPMGIIA